MSYRFSKTEDFLEAIKKNDWAAAGQTNGTGDSEALWKLEGLIRKAKNSGCDRCILNEPELERIRAILHVGWGMDILGDTGFDFSSWETAVQASTDIKYRRMTMEPIGLVYAASLQRLKARIAGISLPPVTEPEKISRFFSRFDDVDTWMISHGYGRGIYFQNFSLGSALTAALDCPAFFNPPYAIRGVAFAYTLVNLSYLTRIFLTADRMTVSNFGTGNIKNFHEGITTALSFLEWHAPGLLESMPANTYVQQAGQMLKHHREQGNIYHF